MPAYRIDCSQLGSCVQRARKLCPAGYDLVGAGASHDDGFDVFDLLGDDDDEVVRSEMVVECTPPKTKPVSGPARPQLRSVGEFRLGSTVRVAQATCATAQLAWDTVGEWNRCGGIIAEPKAPGYSLIRLCGDRVCAVRVVYGPYEGDEAAWFDRFAELRKTLAVAHGEPRVAQLSRLHRCSRNPQSCLERKTDQLELVWTWPDLHVVELTARGTEHSGPYVMVSYASPTYTREQHLKRAN
jgi:hypothetical protein